MRLVIVTGMSGAGKSTALKMLEDARYFCVDNLPIALVGKFVSLMATSQDEEVQNAAIGIDARSGRALEELEVVLDRLKAGTYKNRIFTQQGRLYYRYNTSADQRTEEGTE